MIILDSSDANWWKGSNHRGEGLFPANFVSTDFKEAEETQKRSERRRSVQFNEEVEVKTLKDDEIEAAAAAGALGPVEISEDRIDRVLTLLNDSDPTTDENDDPELNVLEDHVNRMGPMIDNELEKVDRRLAQLTKLSTELVDAMNLYHQLMRELPAQPYQVINLAYPHTIVVLVCDQLIDILFYRCPVPHTTWEWPRRNRLTCPRPTPRSPQVLPSSSSPCTRRCRPRPHTSRCPLPREPRLPCPSSR